MINAVIAPPRLVRPIFESRNASLFLVIFSTVLGVLLIVRAEGATDDRSARAGPFGYLLLLVAGWVALEAVALRVPRVAWAAFATRALLVLDLTLITITVPLQGGPEFLVISLLLVSLFVSALVGILALLLALWALRPSPPRPPTDLVAFAIIAAILTNVAIGAQTTLTGGAASRSTSPIPSAARPSPTPTPTTSSATLRVSLGGKASGTVRSQPSGIDCRPTCEARFTLQTRVALTPTAPGGSMFAGWAQSCSGVRDCEVVIKSDSAVTAFFEAPAPGFQTNVCGYGAQVTLRPDETRQVSVCFQNTGTSDWIRGTPNNEVVLGACCPLGSAASLGSWNAGWPSDRVYARMPTDVVTRPQSATVVFSVHAPKDASPGDYRFDGIMSLASTGAPVMGGAFSILVTVQRP